MPIPIGQIDPESVDEIAKYGGGAVAILWALRQIFIRVMGSFDQGQSNANAMVAEAKATAAEAKNWATAQIADARSEFERRITDERSFHTDRYNVIKGEYDRVAADGDRCRQQLDAMSQKVNAIELQHSTEVMGLSLRLAAMEAQVGRVHKQLEPPPDEEQE